MEVDTGASPSLISEIIYLSAVDLQPTSAYLHTYTGEIISVLGSLQVKVSHHSQSKLFHLLVVKGQSLALLGRDLIIVLILDWHIIHCMQNNQKLNKLLQKLRALSLDKLGKMEGVKVTLNVDTTTHLKFCKATAVPLALRKKLEAALDKFKFQGIIEKIKFSNWAAPIVPINKQDDTITISEGYKPTVNKVAKTDV